MFSIRNFLQKIISSSLGQQTTCQLKWSSCFSHTMLYFIYTHTHICTHTLYIYYRYIQKENNKNNTHNYQISYWNCTYFPWIFLLLAILASDKKMENTMSGIAKLICDHVFSSIQDVPVWYWTNYIKSAFCRLSSLLPVDGGTEQQQRQNLLAADLLIKVLTHLSLLLKLTSHTSANSSAPTTSAVTLLLYSLMSDSPQEWQHLSNN